MTKNMYYRNVFRRENVLRARILDFFLTIASYPRMLIEVFIRKNFGERYFSFATVITVALIMFFYPVVVSSISSYYNHIFSFGSRGGGLSDAYSSLHGGGLYGSQVNPYQSNPYGYNQGLGQSNDSDSSNFGFEYATWYLFLLFFIWAGLVRRQEVKRNPSVFDFARFSLYTGDINPFFLNLKRAKGNMRKIETFYEPLGFFIAGIILWGFGQALGGLLILASLCYCFSYVGAYRRGDDFVMDKIDEMILNEEMETAFVRDEPSDKTRGVRFYARKPSMETLRRKLVDSMVEEEDDDDVAEAV